MESSYECTIGRIGKYYSKSKRPAGEGGFVNSYDFSDMEGLSKEELNLAIKDFESRGGKVSKVKVTSKTKVRKCIGFFSCENQGEFPKHTYNSEE